MSLAAGNEYTPHPEHGFPKNVDQLREEQNYGTSLMRSNRVLPALVVERRASYFMSSSTQLVGSRLGTAPTGSGGSLNFYLDHCCHYRDGVKDYPIASSVCKACARFMDSGRVVFKAVQ